MLYIRCQTLINKGLQACLGDFICRYAYRYILIYENIHFQIRNYNKHIYLFIYIFIFKGVP